jgi:hypothetical protein
MPRYFFNLITADQVVRDREGTVLDGLNAAHWHAVRLVHRIHLYGSMEHDDWVVEIMDETGGNPLVVLPSSVPMRRLSPLLE